MAYQESLWQFTLRKEAERLQKSDLNSQKLKIKKRRKDKMLKEVELLEPTLKPLTSFMGMVSVN